MSALIRRIAETVSSVDHYMTIIFFSVVGLLIFLLFSFDLALSAIFNYCLK